jgi:hypothetical protein
MTRSHGRGARSCCDLRNDDDHYSAGGLSQENTVTVTRSLACLIAAIVAHAFGWILPVVNDYRGAQAFRVALSPLWPYENFHIPSGHLVALSVLSAATNLVFAAVVIAVLTGRVATRSVRRTAVWIVGAAALLNLHWPLSMGERAADLRFGYHVWILSFVLLLLAVHPALAARDR